MFSFNPDLVDDGPMEDGDAAFDNYDRSDDEEEPIEFKEIDLTELSLAAQEVRTCNRTRAGNLSRKLGFCFQVDGTGTVAGERNFSNNSTNAQNGEGEAAQAPVDDAAPINENLFLDECLDGIDDELNDLHVEDDGDEDSGK